MIDVIVVGGGPCGLMLAAELATGGARPLVLEAREAPDEQPKANGLVGSVVPLLDRRGLYEPLAGRPGPPTADLPAFFFSALPLPLAGLGEHPLHALPVPQHRIVEVLAARAAELGVEVRRGERVVGVTQDADGVTVETTAGCLRARWLVGADGAHSVVRTATGIGFPGTHYDRMTTRSAHVTVPADWIDPGTGALRLPGAEPLLPFLPVRTPVGGASYAPLPGAPPLVTTTEWDQPEPDGPMTLAELGASLGRVLGVAAPELADPTGDGPHVLRRLVGQHTRVAERFRTGRVFLVGDAAHVFSQGGGPGLNLGLAEAVDLGWKLAAALRGSAGDDLLDSYDHERGAAARRMVVNARAQAALNAPGDDVTALRELVGELLTDPAAARRVAALVAGADVRLPVGPDAHPLAGWPAPELTVDGVRLVELCRAARPLLVDGTGGGWVPTAGDDDVAVVTGLLEGVAGATALLLRPDGRVVWASDGPAGTAPPWPPGS